MTNISTNSYGPGAVEIVELTAEKFDSNRKVDIRSIVASIQITASISTATMFAKMMLGDGIDFLNNPLFAFTGEEFINVSFRRSNTNQRFNYKFVVATLDSEIKSGAGDSSVFVLTLLSVDTFIDSGALKSKGYTGTITQIIRSILETELKTEIPINNERFVNTVDDNTFAFTEIKPFEKIDILQTRAFRESPSITSIFMFYENRSGYNFEPFEDMMTRAESNTNVITYTSTPLESIDRETEFNAILNFAPRSTFNNHRRMYHGLYNSNVKHFDFLTKNVTKEEISLLENIDQLLHLNRPDPGVSTSFSEKIKALGSLTYFIPFDSSTNDRTKDVLLNNSPFSILLDENTLLVKTFGNLLYDVSDPVNVVILDNNSLQNENKKEDPRYSGKYIIHTITYEISVVQTGYLMYNNMLLIREGALRNTDFYNKQYTTDDIKFNIVSSRN